MRGSPLLRSIFIVLLLIASATVLTHLTAARSPAVGRPAQPIAAEIGPVEIPYRLQLSAQAAEVKIAIDDGAPSASLSGNLAVSSEHPVLSLTVRWKQPPGPGERRFAKLTLEPPGKSTVTHVFDASGDIDDILELP